MSMNQLYNKTITLEPINKMNLNPNIFDLCFYTYNGTLTSIVEKFNHQTIKISKQCVRSSVSEDKHRNALQIASFLNFPNIFLYLLTYDANPDTIDDNDQSAWHILAYRGHTELVSLLLNHLRYKLKIKSLEQIDAIKKQYGFSNLDIVKGKLSRAVYLNDVNVKKFGELQKTLRAEGKRLIKEFIDKLTLALLTMDKQGQTPLHLAAMSKFPLSHKVIYQILDFDFFKQDESWNRYLELYSQLQLLEIKKERMNEDPRRCQRLEKELIALLGDNIIKDELSKYFKSLKKEMLNKVINSQDKNGDSLLHISAFHGDFRIVGRLVFYGGNKKLQNNEGKIPVDLAKDNFVRKVLTDLNKAAKASDEKNIQELVNFGEDINEKISIFSQAPIHKIIESRDENKHTVLKKMLELGSDPNIKDSNGWSALHYACQLGDLESVKILVNAHAIIDTYSNNQRIPLHLAASMNFPGIVKFLLENKSDPGYKDELGCTPMHLAAKQGNTKCLDYLLYYNGDLYSMDFRNWNILHYAAFQGHKKTVRFICKYDADYDKLQNMRNTQNKLPIEIVRDPSIKPYFSSLWHAAREGNLDMTRSLLNEGEDVNEQSHFERNTPLHLAVLNNHYLEVRLLIENKANPSLRNRDKIEPGEYASLMNEPIKRRFERTEDMDRETMDLREIIGNIINKSEEALNATVCKANLKLRVWTANDFNNKIRKALNKAEEEHQSKENNNNINNNEPNKK